MPRTGFSLPYLAGFFDGEGHVSILRSQRPRYKNKRWWLRIGVCCTDPIVIFEFKRRFGGSLHLRVRRSLKHSPSQEWVAQHRVAAECLRALLPWLKVKHADALIALEFQKVVRRDKSPQGHACVSLTPKEILQRDTLRLRLITQHGLATRAVTEGESIAPHGRSLVKEA